jgi:hypothetical protein
MRYSLFSVLVGILMLLPCVNQAQETTFNRAFNSWPSYHEAQAYGIAETPDSNYFLVGFYNTKGLVTATTWNGQELWTKTFDYGAETIFYQIIALPDSQFLIAGRGGFNYNVVLVKMDSEGDTIWTHSLDLGYYEHVTSLQATSDNGYVVGGISYSGNPSRDSIFVSKLNGLGVPEWTTKFAPQETNNKLFSVRQSVDNGYLVCGAYTTTNPYQQFPYLVKLDQNGTLQWSWKLVINPFQSAAGCDVKEVSDGYIFLTGSNNHFVLKTDTSGSTVWAWGLGYGSYGLYIYDDFGPKLIDCSDSTWMFCTLGQWGIMYHFNQHGAILHANQYELDLIEAIPAGDNMVLAIGNGPLLGVDPNYYPPYQFGMVKSDSTQIWPWSECSYDLTNIITDTLDAQFESFSLTIYPATPLIHFDSVEVLDIIISERDGCVDMTSGIEDQKLSNHQLVISPNPSSGLFTISMKQDILSTFPNPTSLSSLEIFDLTGKKVYGSSTPLLLPSTLNLTHLPEGIYLIRWANQTSHGTAKLSIIK